MITMLCSGCGTGYTSEEFQGIKRLGCPGCGSKWFYSNNLHNRQKIRDRLSAEGLPIPEDVK